MHMHRGTNEYNFRKRPDPSMLEPTHCPGCGKVINLSAGGYSVLGTKYS